MEYELDSEGGLHRINVAELDEEDQPEYTDLSMPAIYEPEGSSTIYVAWNESSEDVIFTDTGVEPNTVYSLTKTG
jgi:hypothetical protein